MAQPLPLRLSTEAHSPWPKEAPMLGTVLIVLLILALLGSLPAWPYSSGWGYYPSGGAGLLLLILIVLLATGRL